MERPAVAYEDGKGDRPEGWYIYDGEDIRPVDLLEKEEGEKEIEAQIEALQRKLETLLQIRLINAVLRRK